MIPERSARRPKPPRGRRWLRLVIVLISSIVGIATAGVAVVASIFWLEVRDQKANTAFSQQIERRARSPAKHVVRATPEECRLFALLAQRQFAAFDMPVLERKTKAMALRDAARPSAWRNRLPELSSGDAEAISSQSADLTFDYDLKCDWRGTGLIPLSGLRGPDDQMGCPSNARLRIPDDFGGKPLSICKERPPGGPTPMIIFSRPLRTPDGEITVVDAEAWFGNLGADVYACLFRRSPHGWAFQHCVRTMIS